MTSSRADLLLENIPDDESPAPEERIKDASTGRELYRAMLQADRQSAAQRVRQQAMLDGEPPHDQAVLTATGQGSMTNLNWGDAENIVEFTKSGMIDLVNSVENLVRTPLLNQYFEDEEQRREYEQTLAEEVTKTFRRWEGFDFNYQNLIHHWLCFGVGIGYWEDSIDWRWKTTGLSDFCIPRQTLASEERITIAGCRRRYELHELYEKIRDPERAEKMGWNVQAVKQAMLRADHPAGSTTAWSETEWERLQAQFKNNDLGATAAGRTQTVEVIHLWVQEFDGSVSMYLVSDTPIQDDGKRDPWMYVRRHEYDNVRNAFTFFCYGIGTNGTYHSISGILRKIYPQVQVSNRLRSKLVDAAAMSSGVMLQPLSETSYDKIVYTTLGPYTMLPAKDIAEYVERASPNLGSNVTPVLADMERTMNQRAGQFQGGSAFGGSQEKTRFQVQAELETLSRVGATQLNLFYPSWARMMQEAVRRLCRVGYSDATPGGKEAADFRKRLVRRGFPLEALEVIDFDAVTCERAIGSGSMVQRNAMLDEIAPYVGSFDEAGRHNYLRDRTAGALKSYEVAGRYIQRMPGDQRPPVDKKIAELQNFVMRSGSPIPVEPNDMHVVHLDTHIPFIAQILNDVETGALSLEEAVQPMIIIHEHCIGHLAILSNDPTVETKVAEYNQALQQAGEIIWNGTKKIEAAQRKAAQEQPAQQQEGQSPEAAQKAEDINSEMQRKIIEFQVKIQNMNATGEAKRQNMLADAAIKRQIELEKARQGAALKDATTAAELLSKSRTMQ